MSSFRAQKNRKIRICNNFWWSTFLNFYWDLNYESFTVNLLFKIHYMYSLYSMYHCITLYHCIFSSRTIWPEIDQFLKIRIQLFVDIVIVTLMSQYSQKFTFCLGNDIRCAVWVYEVQHKITQSWINTKLDFLTRYYVEFQIRCTNMAVQSCLQL